MEGRHSSPSHAAPSSRGRRGDESTAYRTRSAQESSQNFAYSEETAREYHDRRASRAEPARASRQAEPPRGRKSGSFGKDLLIIVSMTMAVLLVFAFFHHVRPRMVKVPEKNPSPTPAAVQTPEPTPAAEITPKPIETEQPPEESEVPEVIDNRTEWQKKFADKFTEETVSTDTSYSSPNISVTLESYAEEVNGRWQTWYVADIYVASIDCLRTYFAQDTYIPGGCLAESMSSMCAATGAILATSGDYCNNQTFGLLVRNGEVIHSEPITADICVLYADGTVETLSPDEYQPEEILARNPWQSWKFGPKLLDSDGHAMTEFNTGLAIKIEAAPRCGFGYYEPGHYCLVVNDGRQSHSTGFVLDEFARIFEELGCTAAYNLDGGATAVMAFNGRNVSKPSANRDPGDIFYVVEPAPEQEGNS